jgi:hypothetical protein
MPGRTLVFTPTLGGLQCVTPYLAAHVGEEVASATCEALMARCEEEAHRKDMADDDEDDEGEDLCNCFFSLAYGAGLGFRRRSWTGRVWSFVCVPGRVGSWV